MLPSLCEPGKLSVLNTDHLIRQVIIEDLDRCYAIERAAYAGDAAATREKIAHRIREYPEGFILLEHEGVVAGFVSDGATDEVDLASEAFKDLEGHDPAGMQVVVLSVAVHPLFQGRGSLGGGWRPLRRACRPWASSRFS